MKRKYELNANIFDVIDSEAKAYWLGFLLGDVTVTDYSIKLELSNKDYSHIEDFKRFIESTAPIKNTAKNCSLLMVNSKDLIEKIAKYGLVKTKTYKNVLTPKIPKELLRHFYRGILDSDGWITEHKSKKGGSQHEFGFSSYNKAFLKEIQDWISDELGKSCGYIKERKRGKQKVCQLIIGGNSRFKLIYDLLYNKSSSHMSRKYLMATKFIENLSKRVDKRKLK